MQKRLAVVLVLLFLLPPLLFLSWFFFLRVSLCLPSLFLGRVRGGGGGNM
jgi:hypothetical protein